MKKRITAMILLIVGSFSGGLAISEYRQRAAFTINYTITEYDEDGTIFASSKSVGFATDGAIGPRRRFSPTVTSVLPAANGHPLTKA